MEIELDIGKNTLNSLRSNAEKEALDFEDFSINMLELGLRIYLSSQQSDESQELDQDKKCLLENNHLIKEILRCVFDKDKTKDKVFDSDTLIQLIERQVSSYLDGQENA